MTTENPRKWPIFILIICVILLLILGFVWWRFGSEGFLTILKWFFILAMIFLIIGLIIYAVIWLFKRHKKEMVFIMRRAIIQACKINKFDYPQDLYLLGSEKPFPQPRRLGRILGFSMIKSAIKKMKDPETKELIELENPKDVIFCAFQNGGFLAKLFGDYQLFAGVYPEDFAGELTASNVFIKDDGFGLSPQIFRMLWASKHWHEKHIIDETSKETIHRLIVEDNLNEIKDIIEKGISIEPQEREEPSMAQELGLDRKMKQKAGLG